MKKVFQVAVVCALIAPAGVMISESSASASGCSGSYGDSGRSYTSGPCTGYPSYFHQKAKATCSPMGSGSSYTTYGPLTTISGKSKALCQSGYYAHGGTAVVYDN